jgi:flagellar motility protein MotE (MotC chaperone)
MKLNLAMMARLRLLPLLVIVAAMSFGVRFGEFVSGVSAMPGQANAQTAAEPGGEEVDEITFNGPSQSELSGAQAVPEESLDEQIGQIEGPVSESVKVPGSASTQEWRDAADTDIEYSSMRMELFEDLSARRKALEERERELSVREALLKAAEQELESKYKELLSLRAEIQDLLVVQTEEEQMRIASLVKIYEGMKPKDAARIFNTLDLDVLLEVVSKMSERKSAPILASMEPERARTLTLMLMEQKKLPDVVMPDGVAGDYNS